MHMVVWMNTAGATGKVSYAQVTRKCQEKKGTTCRSEWVNKNMPRRGTSPTSRAKNRGCRCDLGNRRHAGGGREASQPLIGTRSVELEGIIH